MTSRQKFLQSTESTRNSVSKIPRLLKPASYSKNEIPLDAQQVWVDAIHSATGDSVRIMYSDARIIGSGSFGMVFVALLGGDQEVAIKKVLRDKRYKNRELQILRDMQHPNIVSLYYFFYSYSNLKPKEIFLNLVQEFVPQTLSRLIKHYWHVRQLIPMAFVKLYSFQLLRGLAYVHSRNICHRDIKPQNLLVDPESGILKICDFGSTKILVPGEPNISYICSRYYRAPELIFGATEYTVRIDMWSAGCVIGELLLGRPLFPGESGMDQLVEIIKVLGTPTLDQVREMNNQYGNIKFPNIKACSWEKLIHHRNSDSAFGLLRGLLVYGPKERWSAAEGLASVLFSDLLSVPPGHPADATGYLPSGRAAPRLVDNFTEDELTYLPESLSNQVRSAQEAIRAARAQQPFPTVVAEQAVRASSSLRAPDLEQRLSHVSCIAQSAAAKSTPETGTRRSRLLLSGSQRQSPQQHPDVLRACKTPGQSSSNTTSTWAASPPSLRGGQQIRRLSSATSSVASAVETSTSKE